MPNLNTVNFIKTLRKDAPFSGIFVIKSRQARTAKTGVKFFAVALGDKTGSFSCTIFSDGGAYETIRDLEEGDIVRVEGLSDTYKDKFSPKITYVAPVSEAEIEREGLADMLTATSPEDFDKLCAELEDHIAAIPHEGLRKVTRAVLDELGDTFKNSTAAIAMHHAYRHGLLEHSCHLARVARALLPIYPEVDASLAISGALLHDVGKTLEYAQTMVAKRTRLGILHGHIVLGYRIVRRHALKNKLDPTLQERLEHLILSHQGKLEWGAAVLAATPEALFISKVDEFDATMGMVQEALRNTVAGEEFSDKIPGLDMRQILVTPPFPREKKCATEARDNNAAPDAEASYEQPPEPFGTLFED